MFILALMVVVLPYQADAVMQTLNGQTGQNQTFSNDTNVTISSASNLHTLGWSGVLQPSRGGTGTSTAMTQGSILFAGTSGVYSQDNANLFWNDTNNILKLGGDINFLADSIPTDRVIKVADQTSGNLNGNNLVLKSGAGSGTGNGGDISILTGSPGESGESGVISIGRTLASPTIEIKTTSEEGLLYIRSARVIDDDIHYLNGTGLEFYSDDEVTQTGFMGFLSPGVLWIYNPSHAAKLDLNDLTSDRTFNFPDANGTFSLLEVENTFSNPVNNFISNTNSTIHVGTDGIPGCIVMGDDDSSGVTYVTANDGVLSASSTPPANCN